MPATLSVQRVLQQEAHCGPASLAMLCAYYGESISQVDVSAAAGMSEIIIDAGGMRIDEVFTGIQALYPDQRFELLGKYHAQVSDLEFVLNELKLPAGIEWQGHFEFEDGSTEDMGHYSVANGIDLQQNLLSVVDPEPQNLLTRNGTLALDVFEDRWWEVDIVPRPDDFGITQVIEMERLIFVLANVDNRETLYQHGFRPATLALVWAHCTVLAS